MSRLGDLRPRRQWRKPVWLDLDTLPRLYLNNRPLGEDEIRVLARDCGYVVGRWKYDKPLLERATKEIPQHARTAFALAVFGQWLGGNTAKNDLWVFGLLEVWGGDYAVLWLVRLIDQWQRQKRDAFTEKAVTTLRQMGTPLSLMVLEDLAYTAPVFNTRLQADRAVKSVQIDLLPDGGMGDDGTHVVESAGERFTVRLHDDLTITVRDEAGRPMVTEGIDIGRGVNGWQLAYVRLQLICAVQVRRLERAMVAKWGWLPESFTRNIQQHPVLKRVARPLVWCIYDAAGQMTALFRLDEGYQLADLDERPVTLTEQTLVGLPHPLLLDERVKMGWGEVLSDYELWPPFPQLGREVYGLRPEEAEQKAIGRFNGQQFDPDKFVKALESRHWFRGMVMQHGVFFGQARYFPEENKSAVVFYSGGLDIELGEGLPPTEIRCFIGRGRIVPQMRPSGTEPYRLGKVELLILSEVLSDLYYAAFMSRVEG